MTELSWASWGGIWAVFLILIDIATVARAVTREHRSAASRLAWVVVILSLPLVGVIAYFFLGDTSADRRSDRKLKDLRRELPKRPTGTWSRPELPLLYRQAFARAASVNGFQPVSGNRAEVTIDSNESMDWLVEDIDAAKEHVHLLFYIWLTDGNGTRVAEALMRAAQRGVTCRVIVDGLGSRKLLASPLWKQMKEAGVETVTAFAFRFAPLAAFFRRLDIRNHRKIIVIDHDTTYVGSQNCADAAFIIKKKFAPWVDMMMRITGPVAWQSQRLFVSDWMVNGGNDISDILRREAPVAVEGFPAVVAGTGPNIDVQGVPDMAQMLLASAQHDVVITTPYYVPSEALQQQICATAVRGVRVRLNVPANNDSHIVGFASRSFYRALLKAGVEIHEFQPGLLHAKLMTVDGQAAMLGSANLDRRSFDLNYENSMMLVDRATVGELVAKQEVFLNASLSVDREKVESWSVTRRVLINSVGMMAPLL
ncbi:cardiolipin synthase [Aliiroseovarius sp. F20344]|uniref:cardiolipin synthase n=1 Tax=Aliiroseovarius sp. F20344 TaxID=2926414 RepID=UPI001FF6C4BB|nr:cardiolipin synthase [Aliiroseovarius sp. F20344]MCK0143182.1 cardiolipin synthase [Aliiroseovarius sp. F20344]